MAHRVWSPAMCGREFREMMAFVDEPQDVVCHPITGELVELIGPTLHVAQFPDVMPLSAPNLEIRTRVFMARRRCEGRLFYMGRNRRMRNLRPDLVEVA